MRTISPSESELLEEEVNGGLLLTGSLGSKVSGLELLLDFLLNGFTVGCRIFGSELLLGDDVLEIEIILEDESGGHHVVVVDELDEGLHAALSIELLLGHALGDRAGGALDTDDESVSEGSGLLAAEIVVGNNDCLLSCHSAAGENNNSTFLHNFTHGCTDY